ncbi:MAG: hypothetical protein NTV68_11730 [Methanomicrobiales archaeon]|nr:hypothetical protein [Methanomicrobiales archaeon]
MSIKAVDPGKTRWYRGCFKIKPLIGYFQKMAKITDLITQNQVPGRKGVSKGWGKTDNLLIFGIAGLE